jgi:hypothetical protein
MRIPHFLPLLLFLLLEHCHSSVLLSASFAWLTSKTNGYKIGRFQLRFFILALCSLLFRPLRCVLWMVDIKSRRLQDRSVSTSFFQPWIVLTVISSIEHVRSRSAAPSVLHRSRYFSFVSNAHDQYLSKGSSPSVRGVVFLSPPCTWNAPSVLHCFRYFSFLSNAQDQYPSKGSLPSVRGVDFLSPPCSRLTVSCPCTRPSAYMLTSSWSKIVSPAAIGPHPVLRIFVSLVRCRESLHFLVSTLWIRGTCFPKHI